MTPTPRRRPIAPLPPPQRHHNHRPQRVPPTPTPTLPSKRASQRRAPPPPTPAPAPVPARAPPRPRPSATGTRLTVQKSATPTGRTTRRTSAPAPAPTPVPAPSRPRTRTEAAQALAEEEKGALAAAVVAKPVKVGLVVLDGDSVAKSYRGDVTRGMAAAMRHYETQGVRAIAVMPGKGRRTRNVALRIAEREGGVLLCNGDLGGYVRRHPSAARRRQLRAFIVRNRQKFNFFGDQLVPAAVLHGATAPHAQRKGWLSGLLGKRKRHIAL